MRARNIKPGFFKNEVLAKIDPLGRIFFSGLWCIADREGRLEDRPERIRAEILPYDTCDPESILNQLNEKHFILRYEIQGNKYIQILNFLKHQTPHCKEGASTIPAPQQHRKSTSKAQYKSKTKPGVAPPDSLIPDSLIPDSLKNKTYSEFFLNFWDQYPMKKAKAEAFKAWQKHKPDMVTVITSLNAQKEEKEKLLADGKFCPGWPNASTWLNEKRWEDEISDQPPLDATDRMIYDMKKEREKDGHT